MITGTRQYLLETGQVVDMWKISGFNHPLRMFSFELPSCFKLCRMNAFVVRTAAIVLHAAANFIIVTYLFNYNFTGS